MSVIERTTAEQVEHFLVAMAAPGFSVAYRKGGYTASCFWPNGDVVRDRICHGSADNLAAAVSEMWAEVEKAKAAQQTLRTAAECKAAVIALIQEHDAAPASFRDAVDALPVQP